MERPDQFPADPLLGRQIGNYKIERALGRGAMAQVYFGWDVRLHRPVAVKVIDVRFRGNAAYARRFVREAEVVAGLRHDNIVQIYSAGEEDSLYYFAMEYIDGPNLGMLLSRYAAEGELMPQADVLRLGRAIAAALDAAHARGVIHRDVKPSNVLVTAERVVLGDFGLALDAEQGSIGEAFGTAQYVAPEQARNSADAVPQSDLYSLGVMLYEMLTGALPFDDPSPMTLALQHLTLPPPAPRDLNPALSDAAQTVLLQALSKTPSERYPSSGALMDALEEALSHAPPALPDPPAPGTLVQSQRPVAELVALHLKTSGRDAFSPPPRVEQPRQSASSVRRHAALGLLVGGVLLALTALLVFAGAALLLARQGASLVAPTLPAAGDTPESPSSPEPRAPSASPTALDSGAAQAPGGGGRRFLMLYNESSLYLLNLSGSDSPVAPLAFERLDADGRPVSRFSGQRWAQFFPTIMPDACVRLEIIGQSGHLRPPECNNRYNSTRTPNPGDSGNVWTPQEGSSQFRVLWHEVEVGRCEIAAGACEVFLP